MPSHNPKRQRKIRSLVIESLGIEMPLCTGCRRAAVPCIFASNLERCARCVERNSCCSKALPSLSNWEKIKEEGDRLQREEEEAMAKILRLRKQQRSFRSRAADMLRRGLNSLDELDAVKEKERKEQEEREAQGRAAQSTTFQQSLTRDPVLEPSSKALWSFESPTLSDSQLRALLDFPDETAEQQPSHG